ncbi:MAG: lysine--tRNA ligase [Rhodospirillales bacterium]
MSGGSSDGLKEAALASRAWPFVEARALQERIEAKPGKKGYVLFETGYGPSGLPHIGTFGEVVRTTMVRHAFGLISDMPTRLFAFSDDMDGLRKVPDNVPNQEMLAAHLGQPLTSVPDPFGSHESFGHHNNARLRAFLDAFGFEYEFQSATDWYRSGRFDEALLRVLHYYDEVLEIILPTLGPERRANYSPFLPVCARTGRVLQARIIARDLTAGTIVYEDESGELVETPVTGGHCKLQWKADWAMRWSALDVDYEMAGKDLIASVALSSRICRVLGAAPPVTYIYELFLDQNGEKISKSKGNGLSVDEWLRYAPAESLAYFMYQKPRTAKRLFFGVIPKTVDDYFASLAAYAKEDTAARLDNPVWHVHAGDPPQDEDLPSYSLILNLAGVCHAEEPAVLWHYLRRYRPSLVPENSPTLGRLIDCAIRYYRDQVAPSLSYRAPTPPEREALADLAASLAALPPGSEAEAIQAAIYEVGKRHPEVGDLRAWFRCLYETLLGQQQGPRMGSFVALYGIGETIALIEQQLDASPPAAASPVPSATIADAG